MDANTTVLILEENEIAEILASLEAYESTDLHDKVAGQIDRQAAQHKAS